MDEVFEHDLGRYAIGEALGQGSTGQVFKAVDAKTQRPVAIKILQPDAFGGERAYERLERAMRALARARHANIAAIYDVGRREDGAPYIVMEFAGGPSIGQMLRRRIAISSAECLNWLIQVARGLEAAWREGIIHRDVKPDNLMTAGQACDPAGAASPENPGGSAAVVKIVDFGLARHIREPASGRGAAAEAVTPPIAGLPSKVLVGTPRYMSPEQGLGRGVDHRSDIYSLGATFYHVLTGRPPFEAATLDDLVRAHLSAPAPPVHTLNPQAPHDLAAILEKMLEKDPDDRYQDYESLIHDALGCALANSARLRQFGAQTGEGGAARSDEDSQPPAAAKGRPPEEPPKSKALFLAAAALGFLTIVALLIPILVRMRPDAEPPKQNRLSSAFQKLLAAPTASGSAASVEEATTHAAVQPPGKDDAAMYQEIRTVLENAMGLETLGRETYARAAEKTDDKGTKDLLLYLAEEEQNHLDLLLKKYALYGGSAGFVYQAKPNELEEIAHVIARGRWTTLNYAIAEERQHAQKYRQVAAKSPDPVLQQFFRFLAEQEDVHEKKLQALLEAEGIRK